MMLFLKVKRCSKYKIKSKIYWKSNLKNISMEYLKIVEDDHMYS